MKNMGFGVEVELIGSRENASRIVAEYFGTHNEYKGTYYDTWKAYDRQGRAWEFMSDSSVGNGRSNSCEMVTPLLSYEDIEDLQEVVRQLKHNGYRADSSCGIHIHVDNSGMTVQQVKNLVNLVSSHEELIYQSLQIRENGREQWCKKTARVFKDGMNNGKKVKTLNDLKHLWYGTSGYGLDRSNNHYDFSRYHLLNLHSMWQGKGIEFRCFNGTTHAGKIKAYIQFCLALVAKAKAVKWCSSKDEAVMTQTRATMAFFLHYLKLDGEEFKTCRYHMTKDLAVRVNTMIV